MLLHLQQLRIYGPVYSRRLGRSLGINPLPISCKTCTFDCLYCQYGWTDRGMIHNLSSLAFPDPGTLFNDLERVLEHLAAPPDHITLSGNGEPTLTPCLEEIVEGMTAIRDRLAPQAKTAILSNGTTVTDPLVASVLRRLDRPILKLDAGREKTFRTYNRPLTKVTLDAVTEGLARLDNVTIQALFTGGPEGNSNPEEIDAWVDRITRISPRDVQIYSLDRDHPSREITPLHTWDLRAVARRLEERGVSAGNYC